MMDDALNIRVQPMGFYKEQRTRLCYSIIEELAIERELNELYYKEILNKRYERTTEIFDRAYSSITAEDSMLQQKYLSKDYQLKLEKVLSKYDSIFDGGLGCYQNKKIALDIPHNIKPVQQGPFPISYRHEKVIMKDISAMARNEAL